MKYLMITCREATFFMAKKEEGKLPFRMKIKLSIHTSLCLVCKKFEKQISAITGECSHVHAESDLSALTKERIEKMIDNGSFN